MTTTNPTDYHGQRAIFNEISDLYDRYRPTYPAVLAEKVIAYSALQPSGKMLEIGSGTGKGTELFAEQGYTIHCLEPGGNLSNVAREKFRAFPKITFEETTFEAWTLTPETYEVVYAAQSFHWIPAEMGLRKAADALKPNGTLALIWNLSPPREDEQFQHIRNVYLREAPNLETERSHSVKDWPANNRANQIRATGRYTDVRAEQFPWTKRYSSADYIALLDTHSSHQMLALEVKERLYAGIIEVLNHYGGEIVIDYIAVLYLARNLARKA